MERARRLALGQWFTPPPVADLALALALPVKTRAAGLRVLDPACGDGAFLARAMAQGISPRSLTGIDVDPDALATCAARVPEATLIGADAFAVDCAGADYDAVVGNPPYVRQERLPAPQKRAIRERLRADWPSLAATDLAAVSGRGDLAAAFVLRALRLVRPGGRVALVVSGAMLDAGYASSLWRMVNSVGRVVAIVDAPRERWFSDAAVNTIILVLERAVSGSTSAAADTMIARLAVPTEEAARQVQACRDLSRVAEVRRGCPDDAARWPVLMRAPQVWLDFERAAGDGLVRLADLVDIRRGVTSGANDVFYLRRDEAEVRGIESALLRPLVRSPRARGAQRIAIDPAATSYVAVVCPPGDDTLEHYPGVRRYFDAHRDAALRPTLAARPYWWSLPAQPARLFLTKAYAARFVQRVSPVPVVADQRVYALFPKPGVDVSVLAGVLNSTFTALALESCGRASLGEGALEWTVADARELRVLDPRRAETKTSQLIAAALQTLSTRDVGDVTDERERGDRRALDAAVSQLQPQVATMIEPVHDALVACVSRRCNRRRRSLHR